jgi:serine/threonine protein kinase
VGTILGRYQIEAILGQAALGAVYRASHVHTRKSVAMKILHPELARSSDYALRFEREAVTTSRISHPNVVSASDFEKFPDGSMYLVLEHVPGESLRSLLGSGPLSSERALGLIGQLAEALVAVHEAGVIHRSIKPENLLLTVREGAEFLKLTDFGLSTLDLEHDCDVITQVGAAVGTPEYMAPEQVLGQWFDQRADLYALGVVLYEMLAGRVPFSAPSAVRVLSMHLEEEPPALPEAIHPAVCDLVARLLVKQPEARLQSAGDVLLQLENTAAAVAQDDLRSRWTLKSLFRRGG